MDELSKNTIILLNSVDSRESFSRFVNAFAAERAEAEALEVLRPQDFKYVGPFGWKNSSISEFLYCCLSGLGDRHGTDLTWMMVAEMLYLGKTLD